jgi:hypothetical protein
MGADPEPALAVTGGLRPRVALKDFSSAERREIIDEGVGGPGARNAALLDLSGTHYSQLPVATEAGDDDVMGWL